MHVIYFISIFVLFLADEEMFSGVFIVEALPSALVDANIINAVRHTDVIHHYTHCDVII